MRNHPLQAYRSCPSVHGRTGQLVFLCEGDIWHQELRRAAPGAALSVSAARRLTAGGECSSPVFSPCGAWLAFAKLSSETGADEVHVMPASGGRPIRLTALGADSRVVGWASNGRVAAAKCVVLPLRAAHAAAAAGRRPVIIFRTDAAQARPGEDWLHIVALPTAAASCQQHELTTATVGGASIVRSPPVMLRLGPATTLQCVQQAPTRSDDGGSDGDAAAAAAAAAPAAAPPTTEAAAGAAAAATAAASVGFRRLLGRHCADPFVEEWKGYAGGRTGQLWLECSAGEGVFARLRVLAPARGHDASHLATTCHESGGDTVGTAAAQTDATETAHAQEQKHQRGQETEQQQELNIGSPVWVRVGGAAAADRVFFISTLEGAGTGAASGGSDSEAPGSCAEVYSILVPQSGDQAQGGGGTDADDTQVIDAVDLRRHTAFSREFGGDGLPFYPRFLSCADPVTASTSADAAEDTDNARVSSALVPPLGAGVLLCFQRGGALYLLSLHGCGADGGGVRVGDGDGDGARNTLQCRVMRVPHGPPVPVFGTAGACSDIDDDSTAADTFNSGLWQDGMWCSSRPALEPFATDGATCSFGRATLDGGGHGAGGCVSLSPTGDMITVHVRGRLFEMPLWQGPAVERSCPFTSPGGVVAGVAGGATTGTFASSDAQPARFECSVYLACGALVAARARAVNGHNESSDLSVKCTGESKYSDGDSADWELVLFPPSLDVPPQRLRLRWQGDGESGNNSSSRGIGRPISLIACPASGAQCSGGRKFAMINHRHELLVVECEPFDGARDSNSDDDNANTTDSDHGAGDEVDWDDEDETKGANKTKSKNIGKGKKKAGNKSKSKRQARREKEALEHAQRKRKQQQRRRRRERWRRCEDHATWTLRRLATGDTDEGLQDPSWSSDGEWLTFTMPLTSVSSCICVAAVGSGAVHRVTCGRFRDHSPVFDAAGRYLFFASGRMLSYRDTNRTELAPWGDPGFSVAEKLYALPLTSATPSPMYRPPAGPGVADDVSDTESCSSGAEEDDESSSGAGSATDTSGRSENSGDSDSDYCGGSSSGDDDDLDSPPAPPVRIELEDIQRRVIELPVPAGAYTGLKALRARFDKPARGARAAAAPVSRLMYSRRVQRVVCAAGIPADGEDAGDGIDAGGDSDDSDDCPGPADAGLFVFDFSRGGERAIVQSGVSDWSLAIEKRAVAVLCRDSGGDGDSGDGELVLRVLRAGESPSSEGEDEDDDGSGGGWGGCQRAVPSGSVDLSRIRYRVDPSIEWRAMFDDAVRAIEERFKSMWLHRAGRLCRGASNANEGSGGIRGGGDTGSEKDRHWRLVVGAYRQLIPAVSCRGDWSDIVAELLSELGSSHMFEWGGDESTALCRGASEGEQGYLGVDAAWVAGDSATRMNMSSSGADGGHSDGDGDDDDNDGALGPPGFQITHLVEGESWAVARGGALARAQGYGPRVREGDIIVAIDGDPLEASVGLGDALANRAGSEMFVTVWQPPRTASKLRKVRQRQQQRQQQQQQPRAPPLVPAEVGVEQQRNSSGSSNARRKKRRQKQKEKAKAKMTQQQQMKQEGHDEQEQQEQTRGLEQAVNLRPITGNDDGLEPHWHCRCEVPSPCRGTGRTARRALREESREWAAWRADLEARNADPRVATAPLPPRWGAIAAAASTEAEAGTKSEPKCRSRGAKVKAKTKAKIRGTVAVLRVRAASLETDTAARYIDHTESMRRWVAQRSNDTVGYVRMCDCEESAGLAEFARAFALEAETRQALVLDIRGNEGGHVAGVVLSRLCLRTLGHDLPRRGRPMRWPAGAAPPGPCVLVCDECTSSDGDCLAWAFQRLGLGTVVGVRTWGGVDGISSSHHLVDGGVMVQANEQFSPLPVHFKAAAAMNMATAAVLETATAAVESTEAALENCGVSPDEPVSYPPHAYAAGVDPQLARAVDIAVQQLKHQKLAGRLPESAFQHIAGQQQVNLGPQ